MVLGVVQVKEGLRSLKLYLRLKARDSVALAKSWITGRSLNALRRNLLEESTHRLDLAECQEITSMPTNALVGLPSGEEGSTVALWPATRMNGGAADARSRNSTINGTTDDTAYIS